MGERLSQADQDHRLKTMQAMNADLLKLRAEVERLREALREADALLEEFLPAEAHEVVKRALGDTDHE
jgi:hypothetical protein